MRSHIAGLAILAGIAIAPFTTAHAAITAAPSRTALDGNFTVDWSLYGSDGAGLGTPVFQTVGPLDVGVASSSGQLLIKQQGASWNGNFAPGDAVLFQPNLSDSFIVSFSNPVSAVGTQIQDNTFGLFTGYMDFFDSANNLLGEVTVAGNSTTAGDNSAVFIGGTSDSADISYVKFVISDSNPDFPKHGNIGINQLDFTADVPEPASMALLGVAVAGLGTVRRRRRA